MDSKKDADRDFGSSDCSSFSKPDGIGDHQWGFQSLRHEHGEDEANRIVAKRLRELADIVEADGYPKVFGWTDEGRPGPIATYQLTMSFPWGG